MPRVTCTNPDCSNTEVELLTKVTLIYDKELDTFVPKDLKCKVCGKYLDVLNEAGTPHVKRLLNKTMWSRSSKGSIY